MGDAKAEAKTVQTGTKQRAVRRRAVGTRDKIIAHLAAVTEVADRTGMASTRLAEAVGYPGSSVAFAQLLSGMERDGLILREIRGKRTYRITLSPATAETGAASRGETATAGSADADAATAKRGARGRHAREVASETASPQVGYPLLGTDVGQETEKAALGDFDYDELARRLLIQVVRRLAASSEDITDTRASGAPDQGALEQTVAGLERELATAWTKHGTLTAENVKLREQLREAQRSLELARERTRRLPITDELNRAEVVLLERLLSPSRGSQERTPGANAS